MGGRSGSKGKAKESSSGSPIANDSDCASPSANDLGCPSPSANDLDCETHSANDDTVFDFTELSFVTFNMDKEGEIKEVTVGKGAAAYNTPVVNWHGKLYTGHGVVLTAFGKNPCQVLVAYIRLVTFFKYVFSFYPVLLYMLLFVSKMTEGNMKTTLIVIPDEVLLQDADAGFRADVTINAFWVSKGITKSYTLRTMRGIERSKQNKVQSKNFPKALQWNENARLSGEPVPHPNTWHSIERPKDYLDDVQPDLFDTCVSAVSFQDASPKRQKLDA